MENKTLTKPYFLDSVLPINPYLKKRDSSLHLIWMNPFTSDENAAYNFMVKVYVTDGYQSIMSYNLKASQLWVNFTLNLTGLECKHVEDAISLPGNCQEKTVSGALLISEYNEYWFCMIIMYYVGVKSS